MLNTYKFFLFKGFVAKVILKYIAK